MSFENDFSIHFISLGILETFKDLEVQGNLLRLSVQPLGWYYGERKAGSSRNQRRQQVTPIILHYYCCAIEAAYGTCTERFLRRIARREGVILLTLLYSDRHLFELFHHRLLTSELHATPLPV